MAGNVLVTDPYANAAHVGGRDTVSHLAELIAIPCSYEAPQSFFTTNTSECYGTAQALATGVVRLGDLNPRRDPTFVTDTAAGMIAAIQSDLDSYPQGGTYQR